MTEGLPAPEAPSGETVSSALVKRLALEAGFDLAGVAAATPLTEVTSYNQWIELGMAGAMGYLTDHRMRIRFDPKELLPSAQSILCVGLLYNSGVPYSTEFDLEERGWISRYAWGEDYHDIVRLNLRKLELTLRNTIAEPFEAKLCVDTAPLLERGYARMAGLGWIGKNTCLIHERTGSWYFLGEMLLSLPLAADSPPPDRCGSCTRCIDACPTAAIVPTEFEGGRQHFVDTRACISYYTIEKKGAIPEGARAGNGAQVFGCDICQDVCPWNRKAPVTTDARFHPALPPAPSLERLAAITESEFRELFRASPVSRARYRGFLRNVVVAMANDGHPRFAPLLDSLAAGLDELIAEHARWALGRLRDTAEESSDGKDPGQL